MSRSSILIMGLAVAGLVSSACVSRNVERVSSEEAAVMPAPPAPLSAEDRAASVVQVPGIEGTVALAEGAVSPASGVLFVLVRVAGRETGPPLAVKQMPGEMPTAFRITEADSMIPGTPLLGELDIIVRFDQDANAFSREPGDLEGRAGPVQAGGSVQIELRPVVAQEAGPGSASR